MKSKQAVLLTAACVLSAAIVWAVARHKDTVTPPAVASTAATSSIPPRPAGGGTEPASDPAKRSAPAGRPAVDVEKVREEIQEAAVQYSDTELPKFEGWLKSPHPAIRAAAVDGLLQSGLPGGAILLRDAAAASKDPQEIQTLAEGAAILEAPPATARLVESLKNQPNRQPARHFNTGGTAPAPAGQ